MIYRMAILVILGLLPPFGTAVALEIIGKEAPGSITLGIRDLPGSFSGPEEKRVFEKFERQTDAEYPPLSIGDKIKNFYRNDWYSPTVRPNSAPIPYEIHWNYKMIF